MKRKIKPHFPSGKRGKASSRAQGGREGRGRRSMFCLVRPKIKKEGKKRGNVKQRRREREGGKGNGKTTFPPKNQGKKE